MNMMLKSWPVATRRTDRRNDVFPLSFAARHEFLALLLALCLMPLLPAAPPVNAADSPFPVRVSANGRYLEDARGKPFLLHGGTAWSLIVQLTKEETEEYLENRRQKGFHAILVNLIEAHYADNPPKNTFGDGPFTTPGDFSTPDEKYFAHADWVIRKAGEKGILVVLNLSYTGCRGRQELSSRDGYGTGDWMRQKPDGGERA